jgi:predicted porin
MNAYKKAGVAFVFCAAGCNANAQSSVVASGLIDAYAGSVRKSGDAARVTVVNSGGFSTSWFGFAGTEDLGGGLKAEFNLHGFFLVDTGASGRNGSDNMFTRNANVGLSGKFGSIKIGRAIAPNFQPTILSNAFGDSFGFSPLVMQDNVATGPAGARKWIASNAGDTGWSNQIIYSTPLLAGIKFSLHYQAGEVAGASGKKNIGANAVYTAGPLTLTGFYHDVQVANPNSAVAMMDATAAPIRYNTLNRQKTGFVGGSYDFKAVKAFASYQVSDDSSSIGKDMKDRLYSVSASIPAGGGAFLVGHANTTRDGALVGTTLKRGTTSVAYDYFFSKRTDLYAAIVSDKITASSRGNGAGIGLRHRF